jgi:hypothetical protein
MYNNSSISNAAMASSLGFNTLDIMYDQPLWEQIKYYDPSFWEVLVQKGSEALMLRTNKYANKNAPKIPIGTSLNKNHMTICHKTANGNTITMTINQNAWSAHQAHGDYVGSCTGIRPAEISITLHSTIMQAEISVKRDRFWNM